MVKLTLTDEQSGDLISRRALGIGLCNPDAFPEESQGFVNGWNSAVALINGAPAVDAVKVPVSGIGDMSDGYHTFNELYHHRAVLFSVICNLHPLCSWKAKKHHDGTMYDGTFIVGINTPAGQATYHYDIDPYWNMFDVPETEFAPEWDGHTSDEAIRRIGLLCRDVFASAENGGPENER